MEWDATLANWAIGSVSGSPVKRNGNGYLNDQQCLGGLGGNYGMFTVPIRRFITYNLSRMSSLEVNLT